jgi:hypothetical protein
MKIGKAQTGCRYWGYEVASRDCNLTMLTGPARQAARDQIKADVDKVKAAGFRAQNMGYPKRETAERVARDIEEKSGVEMHVFNHDYL